MLGLTRIGMHIPQEREPVAVRHVDLAHDQIHVSEREHAHGVGDGARDLHLEALLDHAKLEHGRLLRIGVDDERDVTVGE